MFANVPYKNRTRTNTFQTVASLGLYQASVIYNIPTSQTLQYIKKINEEISANHLSDKFAIHLKSVPEELIFTCRAPLAKWLETMNQNHLPLNTVGSNSNQGLWILSCEETIQLVYGTSVILFRCLLVSEFRNNVQRDTLGLPPPVNLETI